jgi:hypothetical protein
VGVPVPQQNRRREGHPIPSKPVSCPKEMLHPRSALANEPDLRDSRLTSRDRTDITPTQPSPIKSPIKREGFRIFGTLQV